MSDATTDAPRVWRTTGSNCSWDTPALVNDPGYVDGAGGDDDLWWSEDEEDTAEYGGAGPRLDKESAMMGGVIAGFDRNDARRGAAITLAIRIAPKSTIKTVVCIADGLFHISGPGVVTHCHHLHTDPGDVPQM